MLNWFIEKIYGDTPTCMCGLRMRPKEPKQYIIYSWKCWFKCEWEAFQDDNGKLHWWK